MAPEITIDPRGGGTFEVEVHNPSPIVDGYQVVAANPPPWLSLSHPEIRLLPDKDQVATVTIGIRPKTVVFAQRIRLHLQVGSLADPKARTGAELLLTVPPVGEPVTIRAEPNLVRLRDQTAGRFAVRLDNQVSNYPQRYALAGSDPEGVVRFTFTPDVIEVPPASDQVVAVRFEAPGPEAGQQLSRLLTVTASNDEARAETTVTVSQQTSAAAPDSPVRLRLEPSVVRVRDSDRGDVGVIVDNRGGSKDRELTFSGRDLENEVRFSFASGPCRVRASQETRTQVRLWAEPPSAGEEVTRQFTVVSSDGEAESEVSGTFVQSSGAPAISTAKIRLEPEKIRVRDQRSGLFRVVVDNSRSSRSLNVRLSGNDPEGAVRFDLRPSTVSVAPGGVSYAELQVSAEQPARGEQVVREITVEAGDREGSIETTGGFAQETSASPIATARIWLDPQRIAVRDRRRGRYRVMVDNKRGVLPLRVRLSGMDPERAVRFTFSPGSLVVPPGQVGWAWLAIRAPMPPSGKGFVRQLHVAADDGRDSVTAEGQFAQATSDLLPILRVVLTLLGGLLAVLGAFGAWTEDGSTHDITELTEVVSLIRGSGGDWDAIGQPVLRALVLVFAVIMMLGVLRTKGGLTILSAFFVAGLVIAYLIYASVALGSGAPASGSILVLAGALVGCVGGLCVRR